MTADIEAAKLRQQFAQFFTPELAARILRESTAGPPAPQKARPEFVLALVRDDEPAEALGRLNTVVDLAISCEGLIETIAGSLVVVTFGILSNKLSREELEARRRSLVSKVSGALKEDVSLLHGSGEAFVGLVGASQRQRFGCLFTDFSALLKALSQLAWGETVEWPDRSNTCR